MNGSIQCDYEIALMCSEEKEKPLITPFVGKEVREENGRKVISYGISSFGYDVRLSDKELKIFTSGKDDKGRSLIADPKNREGANDRLYKVPAIHSNEEGDRYVILPPGTGLLGHTVEYFNMPNNWFGMVTPKSSYARLFISAIVTPLQPGWSGDLVLEIVNNSCHECIVYVNEGICQINFFEGDYPNVTYKGVYQNQTGTQEVKI